MPSVNKVKDIYMAKSLEQLRKKAEEQKVTNTTDVSSSTKSLLRLYDEANRSLTIGDEERAYVLFYRFSESYLCLRKSNAVKKDLKYFDSMVSTNKLQEVVTQLETLTESIKKRYSALKESEELRAKEIAESSDKLVTNSNINDAIKLKQNDSNDSSYPIIDCQTLLDCIESSTEITKILILDTRTTADFNESHIDKLKTTGDLTIVNIPENLLIPGLTATKLESQLPYGHSRDAYFRRRTMNKIVIVDKFSEEFITGTPAFNLAEALWKWDSGSLKVKNKPLLLKGGYNQWVLTYPMFSSNASVLRKSHEFTISPKQITLSFNYDLNDDDNEHKNVNNHVVNGVINGKMDDESETNNSESNSRLNSIFQPRPTNTAIPGTALPLIPDRSMKPKFQIEDKSTKQKSIQSNEDFEKVRLRKQNEALEEMLTVVQEGHEQTIKYYQEEMKKKDEAMRKFLPEKPSQIPTPNVKPSVSSVITINGDVNASDRRNGVYIQDNENGEYKENDETEFKTNNANVSINGNTSHNLSHEKSNELIRTPKNLSKSPNSLSVNSSNLSRSLSSPNIAQLLAKEEELEADIEKSISKSRSSTNPPQPQFDRSLKPINHEILIDSKLRDFSPVYSAGQSITGLKNLGNTCFMNAVIQCLLNTPDFPTFFNGNFKINRNTKLGSNGELALELAALFRTMAFPSTYKSISPKDFKVTVSKHLSGFIGCNQQDSHEFMVMLLQKLHEDLNESNAKNIIDTSVSEDLSLTVAANKFWKDHLSRNRSIITDIFEGLLVHTLTCLTCHKTSNSFEVFSCLSLPLPNYRTTLNECFRQFLKDEKMSGDTAWECPTCKQKREADKKVAIWKLPKVLLVHLKRFFYEGQWRQKLQTYVEFPIEDLTMRSLNSNDSHYSLYGVVNHYGTLEGGHYTAYSRSPKYKWHRFDDSEVTQINSADVKTQAAYILFYKCL